MDDQEIIREFLIETNENMIRLDLEIVELEQRPMEPELLASIFRTMHTLKGSCGILGYPMLERIAHVAENILSEVRAGQRSIDSTLISLILDTVDAVRAILLSIEDTGAEGPDKFDELRKRLQAPVVAPPVETIALPDPHDAEGDKILAASDTAIRVEVDLLDNLMNLVGELVLARNQILQCSGQREDPSLNNPLKRLNLITTELQEGVMKTRMQPIGVVWNKLPRLVRDVSHALGKQVRLQMNGAGTELDKTIIEAIKDPLTHLVRNACDHGIERPEERIRKGKPAQGVITLLAFHEGGQVNIEIADDGAGIDVERVKRKAIENGLCSPEQAARMSEREALDLIFRPGFSTAQSVTNVSGRGVGMDVVKSNIEKISGTVDISSRLGEGATVKIKIPLTLAIIPGLLVSSGGERFVIPQVSLLELVRLENGGKGKLEDIHGIPVYRRRGTLLPIAHLNHVLDLPAAADEAVNIVVLQAQDHQFGLVVDHVHDTQEIVVKPLAKLLKDLTVYAGATILGDGRVALILDVLGIGQRSGVLSLHRAEKPIELPVEDRGDEKRERLLLFRSGSFPRLAVPLPLISRLEEVPQSAIERSGNRHVMQYRGGILPLYSLSKLLDPESPDSALAQDPAQVVVFQEGECSVGLVVDRIIDVVEEAIAVRGPSHRFGLLGSAVVGQRVVDLVDLKTVIEHATGGVHRLASAISRESSEAPELTPEYARKGA